MGQKHRCKYCKKCFPSGRSLGGHMRSHLDVAAAAAAAAVNYSSDVDEQPQSSSRSLGYRLRDNPKKSWRMSVSGDGYGEGEGKLCEVCGKEFFSWRALFGHMRCHSEVLKEQRRQHKEEKDDEVMVDTSSSNGTGCKIDASESRSNSADTKAAKRSRKRSRRGGRAALVFLNLEMSVAAYGKEEEDGAIALMMLSRGAGDWGGFGSVQESSDKNSVVLEDKKTAAATDGDANLVPKDYEFKKKPKVHPLGADDVADDGGLGYAEKDLNSDATKVAKKRCHSLGAQLEHAELDAAHGDVAKRSQFQCTDCDKCFVSYQALGGHRASSHKRVRGCITLPRTDMTDTGFDSVVAPTDENAIEEEEISGWSTGIGTGYRSKSHECTVCGKIFSSGQALGGHKRAHVAVSSGKIDVAFDSLDLNLPAADGAVSASSAGNQSSELKPWWVLSSSMQHEQPLLGVQIL